MARVAEYIAALAGLLGETKHVHLVDIVEGSTTLVHEVEHEAMPKVVERTEAIRRGEAAPAARDAYRSMNRLLRADSAHAVLRKWRRGPKLLDFPGIKEAEEPIPVVRQFGSVSGDLVRVGGMGDEIPILLEVEGRQMSGFYTSKPLAKEMATLLFEPIRVRGQGIWERTIEGDWTLKRFKVEGFERLAATTLASALAGIRSLVSDWDEGAYDDVVGLRTGNWGDGSN
ncbi:MAG: hypothetical protein WD766_03845 [Gemmatimonadota bacterium]